MLVFLLLRQVLLLTLLLIDVLRVFCQLFDLGLQLLNVFLLLFALLGERLRFLPFLDHFPCALMRLLLLCTFQLLYSITQHLLLVLHRLHYREMLVLLVLLRQGPELAYVIVVKHAVSILPLRHQHDLIF